MKTLIILIFIIVLIILNILIIQYDSNNKLFENNIGLDFISDQNINNISNKIIWYLGIIFICCSIFLVNVTNNKNKQINYTANNNLIIKIRNLSI